MLNSIRFSNASEVVKYLNAELGIGLKDSVKIARNIDRIMNYKE